MKRKNLTWIEPVLLPLRNRQKKYCFYLRMRLDKNRYTDTWNPRDLPYPVYEAEFPIIGEEINKGFYLKLASASMNGLLIKPGETFSFWQLIRYAERKGIYGDGWSLANGKTAGAAVGGLCSLSDLLFWLFLHSPLTITERHSHSIRNRPARELPPGADAAVREGWLDLKVKNETACTFQVCISFEEEKIRGCLYAEQKQTHTYEIQARDIGYVKRGEDYYERVSVYRLLRRNSTGELCGEELLYQDETRLGYALPKDILIPEG